MDALKIISEGSIKAEKPQNIFGTKWKTFSLRNFFKKAFMGTDVF